MTPEQKTRYQNHGWPVEDPEKALYFDRDNDREYHAICLRCGWQLDPAGLDNHWGSKKCVTIYEWKTKNGVEIPTAAPKAPESVGLPNTTLRIAQIVAVLEKDPALYLAMKAYMLTAKVASPWFEPPLRGPGTTPGFVIALRETPGSERLAHVSGPNEAGDWNFHTEHFAGSKPTKREAKDEVDHILLEQGWVLG